MNFLIKIRFWFIIFDLLSYGFLIFILKFFEFFTDILTEVKGLLSGLRYLSIYSPLAMIKNVFYLMFKALFVVKVFTFLSWLFGYIGKRLDKKTMINFKIYELTDWTGNNYNTHISQYLKYNTHIAQYLNNDYQAMKFKLTYC